MEMNEREWGFGLESKLRNTKYAKRLWGATGSIPLRLGILFELSLHLDHLSKDFLVGWKGLINRSGLF